ncbi:hypothetical protein [Haladaptatus halobius]|uniref:hypothetical protein n=1 Tax=Haladaptatus halobius TaxID=2884875 RepID=UPI001D0A0555|nr:hypothetical protein [Haladaptatus halobius]
MNKLRITAITGGVILFVAATWGALEYGNKDGLQQFVWVAALGVLVSATPDAIAVVKHTVHQHHREFKAEDTRAGTKDRFFTSTEKFNNREEILDTICDVVKDTDDYERVVLNDFPEGTGLSIRHAGFHNSFVRVSASGRLILAGASKRTADLAGDLTEALGTSFDQLWANPMSQRKPIKGGFRIVLTVALVTATGLGVGSVATAGYPSNAYNPLEKVALASYDVYATVDPDMSENDAAIAKARFRVTILRESTVEIRWTDNESARLVSTGQNALRIADDTRSALVDLRDRDLTARQRSRVNRIATDLREAEDRVATSLQKRADDQGTGTGADDIREITRTLRSHRLGS